MQVINIDNPRQQMLDQAMYNYTQGRAKDVADIGAQKNFAGALGNETSEVQKVYAPAMQQQQQNMSQYQSLMDLTGQLAQVKQAYDTANNSGQLTDDLKLQLGQKADILRSQLKALPNVPQDVGMGNTSQLMQSMTPVIAKSYEQAVAPIVVPQEQMLTAALNTAKASHGALSPEQALQYGQNLSKGFDTQQAAAISKLQSSHNKIIINHLENQMNTALQNKDYGTAATISMQLEPYGIKTPEWIGKMAIPEKPLGHVTLSNGDLGIINADGTVTDTGTGVYIAPSKAGGVGSRGGSTGIGSRGGVGRTAAAWGPKASYEQSGQLANDIDTFNKWANAPAEDRAKYSHAANLASAKINAWIAAGHDVEGLSAIPEDTDNGSGGPAPTQSSYDAVMADIWNSDTDDQRNTKINNYENDGALDAFRDAGFSVDNDLEYVKSNGASENASAPGSEESEEEGYNDAGNWQDKYDNMMADIWNSKSSSERESKIAYYNQQKAIPQFRDSGFDVDNDLDYIRSQQGGEGNDDDTSNSDGSSSHDEDWYNTTSNAISNNHPDWSDDDIKNYMTYLLNNNTDYDGS